MNMNQYHAINHILYACNRSKWYIKTKNIQYCSNVLVRLQEPIRKCTVGWFCRLLYPSIFILLCPTGKSIATILQNSHYHVNTTVDKCAMISFHQMFWMAEKTPMQHPMTSHLTSGGGIVDPPIGKKSGLLRLFLAIRRRVSPVVVRWHVVVKKKHSSRWNDLGHLVNSFCSFCKAFVSCSESKTKHIAAGRSTHPAFVISRFFWVLYLLGAIDDMKLNFECTLSTLRFFILQNNTVLPVMKTWYPNLTAARWCSCLWPWSKARKSDLGRAEGPRLGQKNIPTTELLALVQVLTWKDFCCKNPVVLLGIARLSWILDVQNSSWVSFIIILSGFPSKRDSKKPFATEIKVLWVLTSGQILKIQTAQKMLGQKKNTCWIYTILGPKIRRIFRDFESLKL